MKLHRDTTRLLPLVDTAPPVEVGLEQDWKVTPVMLTVELTMLKAGPVRLLQSNTVPNFTPTMTSDVTLVMFTTGSMNTPALRTT
jgi:hypothetical protein